MLGKQQVLEEKKFRLSQEEARLNLEAEIAKSAAKGQALAAMVIPPSQPICILVWWSRSVRVVKLTMTSSQYSSKSDKPGNIQKVVFKLPFSMRERWCRCADDIMEIESRPVKFSDLVTFVDREARIANDPVFGNISANAQPSSDQRPRRTPQLPAGFQISMPKSSDEGQ